jgi:hypothetical protein
MSPAAHALDRRLHTLRAAQEEVAASLAELDAEEAYQQLAGRGWLAGATAAKARPALARVAELRPGLTLLEELLVWAGALRNGGRMDDDRATELVSLLNSPTLVLPAPAGDAQAPRTIAPQELLDSLEAAVAPLRAVVTAVDAAWKELPGRLERASADAERLALELPAFRSVAAARAALTDLPARVAQDPLGAADDLERVQSALTDAQACRADITRLGQDLTTAEATVAEIESLIGEGRDGLARSLAEIHEPWGLLDPLDGEVVTGERGLRPWLDRLHRLVAEGRVALAGTGLASWRALADQALDAARQVAAANNRPVARRLELQRLLGAARVKASASGRADDPRVAQLADQAHRALLVPCDIDVAENRVDAFIDALRRRPRTLAAPATPATPPVSGLPGVAGGAPASTPAPATWPADQRREMSA